MRKKTPKKSAAHSKQLQKCPTGIKGFDEITEGGLPKNRTTLVSGSTGSGKTLLGIDFLINGAIKFKEPGVFMSFEETEDELFTDVASLNLDLQGPVARKKILIEHVLLEKKDNQETDFNLEGLFVRLKHAIKVNGGKTFAQDMSAEVDFMLLSAQASSCVDFVMPLNKIPGKLKRLAASLKT